MSDNLTSVQHFDADTLAFVERDLLVKSAKIYKRQYPAFKLANGQILPIKIQPELAWADEVEIEEYDTVGMNCLISDYSKGGTRVGTLSRRVRYKIKTHGNHCGWSWEEINKASTHNRPLVAQRMEATREAYDKYINYTGFMGDEEAGLPGIFTTPLQRRSSSVQINSSFTPDQIIGMLNDHVNYLVSSTNDLASPAKLIMPVDKRNYLFNPRPYGDKSIGQMFLDNQRELGYIKEIVADNNLKGKGAAGTDVMLVLPNDEDKMYVSVPMPYTILPQQVLNLEVVVHTVGRYGGVQTLKPMEGLIVENV